ncbi:DUF2461 domain-containing protein [Luteimonas yindakuii]|uniref:DUF2461 domain-containing protein n=1 Tax=Luteimonas yindakuii TaxID=2565782 RepID=A0A4Z1R3H3_9GAMM|nr:DUF2461 domain-containing protein [Luteimonas yindakuii]TKS54072.1 DUF2461 domain-containing protein [Luteimonas yindakuii]
MPAYFSDQSLRFLHNLSRHNERDWFHAHRADYETHVREPFQRLLADLQPDLAAVSLQFRADPRPVGGSLFRIHRDTRYAHDKSPYKRWQGAKLFHARHREVPTPSWYIHLQPGENFLAAGIWHPETPVLRRIRQFLVDNPQGWRRAAHDPALQRRWRLSEDEMLVRVPRGYPEDFEFRDDLRRRNFVIVRALDDATMTGPRLRQTIARELAATAPFMDYLCAALDLEF